MSNSDLHILRKHSDFLTGLNESELEQLVRDGRQMSISAGEVVLETGQEVEEAYLLLEGMLAVLVPRDWGESRILYEVDVGSVIGEIEILRGGHCMAEVRALMDSRLLCLPRNTFEQLLESHEDVWLELSGLARKRTCQLLMAQQLSTLFGTARMEISDPLLRLEAEGEWLNFEHEILQKLEDRIEWVQLKRGHYLFHKEDEPDGAYILISGLLGVVVTDDVLGERDVAQVRQGEIVGELGLIIDARRSASIRALRDSELFRLGPEVFTTVMEKYPRRMLNVYRTITERFYQNVSGSKLRPRRLDIAILPIHSKRQPGRMARELLQRLGEHTKFEHLSSTSVAVALGRTGWSKDDENNLQNDRLVQWLNGREPESGLVVYEGDEEWSNWNRRCLRQADSVYILADAQDDPDLAFITGQVIDSSQELNLVLLHPQETDQPKDSARWLKSGSFQRIYHVRENNAKDIARMARILGGCAIGLVLGGGGARGFAHLGVLKALEELGVPVDMVGGTSIGAPIAGWIAQNRNAEDITKSAVTAFKSLIDLTLPFTSMVSGRRISSMIAEQTAAWDIEDYWLPFFCVSTNLTTFKPHIHRRGNSAHAIRASVSIPGVLPPVPDAGELLVDGGVLNNLPIDIMRKLNPNGTVIAIDVVVPQDFIAQDDYGHSLSGWRTMLNRFTPWRKAPGAPSIANILMQSIMVGSSLTRHRMLDMGLADYYQNINVKGISLLQFEAVEQAAAIGYEQSIEPLRKWVASKDVKPGGCS